MMMRFTSPPAYSVQPINSGKVELCVTQSCTASHSVSPRSCEHSPLPARLGSGALRKPNQLPDHICLLQASLHSTSDWDVHDPLNAHDWLPARHLTASSPLCVLRWAATACLLLAWVSIANWQCVSSEFLADRKLCRYLRSLPWVSVSGLWPPATRAEVVIAHFLLQSETQPRWFPPPSSRTYFFFPFSSPSQLLSPNQFLSPLPPRVKRL